MVQRITSVEMYVVASSITFRAQFDFRGETFTPSATIELDQHMAQYGELPDFHQWLAKTNHIDPYSYQYEVLESCELEYSNATGIASDFLQDSHFDVTGFQQHWFAQRRLRQLQEIAHLHLSVDDLEANPALKAALLEAYAAGKENR